MSATPAQLARVEQLVRALTRPPKAAQLEEIVLAAADADLANVSEAALEALERVWVLEAKAAQPQIEPAAPATPTSEAPTSEAPTSEAPTSEAPTSEAPTSEALTSEALTSEAPTPEAPSLALVEPEVAVEPEAAVAT